QGRGAVARGGGAWRGARRLAALGLAAALAALGTPGCEDDEPLPSRVFSREVTRVVLEVDYAAGAEPSVAAEGEFDPWDVTRRNAEALFRAVEGKSVVVPSALGDMQRLDDVPPGPYDRDALRAVAERHRDRASSRRTFSYYVLWLPGIYRRGGRDRPEVLGVTLIEEGIIALFKPALDGAAGGLAGSAFGGLVEQMVLTHELGHAVGLVDNGVEEFGDHHDDEHPTHCRNPDCVMYFGVEGAADLLQFLQQSLASNGENLVLFDDDCLDDAAAAATRWVSFR
ncbi:MAG TPA: hypothetical protein VFS00_16820, partial [Polyangiaceae bacterium]|nr:hypothetical protein [Polyangiaceae bacterium]